MLLDRDGTINQQVIGDYVRTPEQLHLIPGAGEAIARINGARIPVVVLTNQRGVARGLMGRGELDAVHTRLAEMLAEAGAHLEGIAVCPHAAGECRCRKPEVGLFEEALRRAPWADPSRCLMVGDMPSDLDPARQLGMRTASVDSQRGLHRAVEDALRQGPSGVR